MNWAIIHPQTQQQWSNYYHLRWQLLRMPWKQPKGSEQDLLESNSIHVMVVDSQQSVLAVARGHQNSKKQAQIRYMAVLGAYQNQGIGQQLLQYLEQQIQQCFQVKAIVLNARESAIGFYLKQGYQIIGTASTLYGCIPHVKMQKRL